MAIDPAFPLASLEALEPVLRRARAELDELAAGRRRDVATLAEVWRGGHRARFDEDLAHLEARVRRGVDELGALILLVRRGLDDLVATPAAGGSAAGGAP